jgi:hypothetical protein
MNIVVAHRLRPCFRFRRLPGGNRPRRILRRRKTGLVNKFFVKSTIRARLGVAGSDPCVASGGGEDAEGRGRIFRNSLGVNLDVGDEAARHREPRKPVARPVFGGVAIEKGPSALRAPGSPHGCAARDDGPDQVRLGSCNLLWNRRNPLKSPESDEGIQENPSLFTLESLLFSLDSFGGSWIGLGKFRDGAGNRFTAWISKHHPARIASAP